MAYQPIVEQPEVFYAGPAPEMDATTNDAQDNEELGAKIAGRAALPPIQWPKNHAMQALKHFDQRFEPTLTGFCEKEEMAILIWLITGVKPLYKCADLGCTHWTPLFNAINKGQERKKDTKYYIILLLPVQCCTPPHPSKSQPNSCYNVGSDIYYQTRLTNFSIIVLCVFFHEVFQYPPVTEGIYHHMNPLWTTRLTG